MAEQLNLFPSEEQSSNQSESTKNISGINIDSYNENIETKSTPIEDEIPVFTALELLNAEIKEMPTLFDPIIPLGQIMAITGASETGKSTLARQLATSVVTGADFLGFKNKAKHRSALIVSTEDDEKAIIPILKKNKESIKFDEVGLENLRYLLLSANIIQNIKTLIERKPVDVIIIDSPIDIFDGKDFNEAIQVRKFLNKFKAIAHEHGCTIIFIHHTAKRTENYTPSKNNILGSQSFEAAMRLVLELRFDTTDSSLRHLCVVKTNYMHSDVKKEALILEFDKNLVFHNTGNVIATCDIALPRHGSNKKSPDKYSNEYHIRFLSEIYTEKEVNYLSQNELNQVIQQHYKCSEKPAREFVSFFEKNEWIINTSNKSNKKTFILNSKYSG